VTETESAYGHITEEGIAQLRARIGKTYPIDQPYIRYVNADSIGHVCRSIGDQNPLFTDPAAAAKSRFGRLVAPPAIFYGTAWGSWDLRRGEGLPGVHGLHSGDHWWYYRPVFEGDELHATKKLIKADPMKGRLAGSAMLMQVREIDFFNQNDQLVARQHMPVIRAERDESKKRGKYSDIPPAVYSAAEIEALDAELNAESARGAEPRYWEDVAAGDAVAQAIKGPLTLPDMITWLQGIGSPHVRSGKYWLDYRTEHPKVAVPDPISGILQPVERVHWDPFMAGEIGMPSAYDYGSQRGAYATYFLTNWIGDEGWVVEMEWQYRGMFFLGDVMRINGSVTRTWEDETTGLALAEVEFHSVNQRGEDIMPGRGVVALPRRGGAPVEFPVELSSAG
jgi:acyl dehydratase